MRTTHKNASSKGKALIDAILENIPGLGKPRKSFIVSILILYLSMRGRYNFSAMSRYGGYCEKTYRLQFEKEFDFFGFNIELCRQSVSDHVVLVFDPSYLPKSGKHTPQLGKFYSGCFGKALKGLEIGGLGMVDIDNNTAMSLEAVQTPGKSQLDAMGKTLIDHYAGLLLERQDTLSAISTYLAVDGYFAKKKFVNTVADQTALHVVSKFRQDANLKYLYRGPKKKGKGRPRKFAGKINLKKPDPEYFEECHEDDGVVIYEAVVWAVRFKRKVKLAFACFKDEQGCLTKRRALFFSTDPTLNGYLVYRYYKARFQIEFLFRDAKQHLGLAHCQARSEKKLNFHFNVSLTSVGLAKATHYLSEKPEQRNGFSLADIKTSYFNEHMLNLFLSNFKINPELTKNKLIIRKLLNFGRIRA